MHLTNFSTNSAVLYRVIHEEGPIFLEGDGIGLYEKKKSYERVPNSAWLPKQSRLNLQT
jgi:hypothetical protein